MKDKFTFIDLGLPSGRLWASENAEEYFTYDDAKKEFGDLLPKPEAFEELWRECRWLWDVKNKGMIVVGPNKNTIFLPASGFRYRYGGPDNLGIVGQYGQYWSHASLNQDLAYSFGFHSDRVFPMSKDFYKYGFSVRLCKEQ